MNKIIHLESRSNYRIKKVLENEKNGKVMVFEGEKLIHDILIQKISIEILIIENAYYQSLDKTIIHNNINEIWIVSREVIKKISGLKSPSSIIAITKVLKKPQVFWNQINKIIALENIQDPANAGAILRSAAAFKIDLVILSGESVNFNNRKFIRAAQNSIFEVKCLIVEDLDKLLSDCTKRKINIYTTSAEKKNKFIKPDMIKKPCLILFGNEGSGLSKTIIDKHTTVCIPQSKTINSLNLAISSSIIMYEISKD